MAAYQEVTLHDPPKWIKQPWDEYASALYDFCFFDCDGKLESCKYVRTYNPKMGITDLRSLKDMQAGCCPPQLLAEFLEVERLGAKTSDGVEEAMALHKKGYLGGGS